MCVKGSRPSVATKGFIIVNYGRRNCVLRRSQKWHGHDVAPTAGFPSGIHCDAPVKGPALTAPSRSQVKGKSRDVLGANPENGEAEEDLNPQVVQPSSAVGVVELELTRAKDRPSSQCCG